jgi:gluconolactonase
VEGVYRLDQDGTVTLLTGQAGKPNGIVISPQQHTLYVSSFDDARLENYQAGSSPDPGVQGIFAFDLAADGSLSNRRLLVDLAPQGGPDGMTIDTDGRIYVAIPEPQPGIYVYSPEGEQVCEIKISRESDSQNASSIHFN